MWSTIDDRTICRFTSDAKDKPVSEYWVGGWVGGRVGDDWDAVLKSWVDWGEEGWG